jgi:hypothetical protein
VLEVYQRVGLNECSRQTKVDKGTILRWARTRNFDTAVVADNVAESHRGKIRASAARSIAKKQEERERIIDDLIKISRALLVREGQIIAAGGFDKDDLQAVSGARFKAIQQLELLEGRATQRSEVVGMDKVLGGVAIAFAHMLDVLVAAGMAEQLRTLAQSTFAEQLRAVETEAATYELPPAHFHEEEEPPKELEPPAKAEAA